ncbi:MAG: type II toxin-antitoxin system mRNA interferase toxin, RelE/StbE family, partial [Tetragenococcus koreensis]
MRNKPKYKPAFERKFKKH